jgi:hypothetical protein
MLLKEMLLKEERSDLGVLLLLKEMLLKEMLLKEMRSNLGMLLRLKSEATRCNTILFYFGYFYNIYI